jgi:hypothetical protein
MRGTSAKRIARANRVPKLSRTFEAIFSLKTGGPLLRKSYKSVKSIGTSSSARRRLRTVWAFTASPITIRGSMAKLPARTRAC